MQHLLSPPNILLAALLALATVLIHNRRHDIKSHLTLFWRNNSGGFVLTMIGLFDLLLLWLIRDNWHTIRYFVFASVGVSLLVVLSMLTVTRN